MSIEVFSSPVLEEEREKVAALEEAAKEGAKCFFSNLLKEGWKKISLQWWERDGDEEGDEEYFVPPSTLIPSRIEVEIQGYYDSPESQTLLQWVESLETVVYLARYTTEGFPREIIV